MNSAFFKLNLKDGVNIFFVTLIATLASLIYNSTGLTLTWEYFEPILSNGIYAALASTITFLFQGKSN